MPLARHGHWRQPWSKDKLAKRPRPHLRVIFFTSTAHSRSLASSVYLIITMASRSPKVRLDFLASCGVMLVELGRDKYQAIVAPVIGRAEVTSLKPPLAKAGAASLFGCHDVDFLSPGRGEGKIGGLIRLGGRRVSLTASPWDRSGPAWSRA